MNEEKSWWESRTIWAGVIGMLAPTIAGLLHVTLQASDTLVITDAVVMIVSGLSSLVVVWGRVRANAKITS